MSTETGNTYTVDTEPAARDIDDIDLHEYETRPVLKFLIAFLIGGVFFLLPVPYQAR